MIPIHISASNTESFETLMNKSLLQWVQFEYNNPYNIVFNLTYDRNFNETIIPRAINL